MTYEIEISAKGHYEHSRIQAVPRWNFFSCGAMDISGLIDQCWGGDQDLVAHKFKTRVVFCSESNRLDCCNARQ